MIHKKGEWKQQNQVECSLTYRSNETAVTQQPLMFVMEDFFFDDDFESRGMKEFL